MKVLLLKDVYKLGHAGDIKKVANGYGRNYLIPQGLAMLATSGAVKQADSIRKKADTVREALNSEMSGLAKKIEEITLTFVTKAGETGKLYGSITNQMIAEELSSIIATEIDRRDIDAAPIRTLGEHSAIVRLTVDLTPEIKVVVFREGEVKEVEASKEKVKLEKIEAESVEETEEETSVEADGSEETE